MDWRAQSRSRSRAPDFRVSAAPPTVDVATATANFSRFYGDSSTFTGPTATINPTPSFANGSGATSSSSSSTDSRKAQAQLAASLGLSQTDFAHMHFDGLTMPSFSDLPTPVFAATTPPVATTASSTAPLTSSSSSFSFPSGSASPDPQSGSNLAAIENTLNQLIALQTVPATQSDTASGSSGRATGNTDSLVKPTSPSSSFANATLLSGNQSRGRQPSLESNYASLAQQQLQQLASVRLILRRQCRIELILNTQQSRQPSYKSSAAQTVSSPNGTSAYLTAASLAQSSRPFSFTTSQAAGTTTGTSPQVASSLGLARPLLSDISTSFPASQGAFFSQPPSPFAYPSSAPGPSPGFLGSPAVSAYSESTDANQFLYDYFAHNPAPSSGYTSPFPGQQNDVNGTGDLGPTHIDPAQLFQNLQQQQQSQQQADHPSRQPRDVAGASKEGSQKTASKLAPKPSTVAPAKAASSGVVNRKAKVPALLAAGLKPRSASTSDLVGLAAAAKNKTMSAPASRAHSRSNTISMPATVIEGQPLQLPEIAPAGPPPSDTSTRLSPSSDGVTRCVNCSTTVSWQWTFDCGLSLLATFQLM